jgi:predicted PurR-regulated permease PerM
MGQFDPSLIISLVVSLAGSISQLLSSGVLILLTVVFILLEASSLPGKVARAFASDTGSEALATRERYQSVVESVRSYIALKTVISFATGLLIAVWLWLFGVPYAGLWGLLAFLLNYIPNVGSIIAAIPALLIAWLDLGWLPAVACGIGFLAVNLVVGNFVEPRLMGRGMGLSPLIVFCSMVFWGWVLGPVGMLLSVPLTMAVRVAMEGFDDTRWLGILLGN